MILKVTSRKDFVSSYLDSSGLTEIRGNVAQVETRDSLERHLLVKQGHST
jgi:hypothetical protein